jgi:hypothetical protein
MGADKGYFNTDALLAAKATSGNSPRSFHRVRPPKESMRPMEAGHRVSV